MYKWHLTSNIVKPAAKISSVALTVVWLLRMRLLAASCVRSTARRPDYPRSRPPSAPRITFEHIIVSYLTEKQSEWTCFVTMFQDSRARTIRTRSYRAKSGIQAALSRGEVTETITNQGSGALIIEQTCRGLSSAVSKPMFVSKYSFRGSCSTSIRFGHFCTASLHLGLRPLHRSEFFKNVDRSKLDNFA